MTKKNTSKKLVIVESPTKAKTLTKILPNEYIIEASLGHIRDLPKKGLGIDIEHNFAPTYEVPQTAKKTVNALKKQMADVDGVILATDPDREGEAIAWHLQFLLSSEKKYASIPYSRVVFHELTREAVLDAFSHEGTIDNHLVDSQQARRVLDRLVGYKLSPLLWKKVRYGLSAGRVQSVAVRLIVEKERERRDFKSEEYWSLTAEFKSPDNQVFNANFFGKNAKKIEVKNEQQAQDIVKDLATDTFKISQIKKTQRNKATKPPHKTSTLQQTMANVYGFTAIRTMKGAQSLFENGLITYHRTDSLSLAPTFIEQARSFVGDKFGNDYLPQKPNIFKTKSKNAQEAHEAIRPTDIKILPGNLKATMSADAKKTYLEIWKRAVESQLPPVVYDQTSVTVNSGLGYEFKATGSTIKFLGWLKVSEFLKIPTSTAELIVLPELKEEDSTTLVNVEPKQHFTQPPARYSDASLIKALEDLGIGRPSTYAPTIGTILKRGYVTKEGRYFVPDDVAFVVTDLLVEHFPTVTGYEFTADMENKFDEIAAGEVEWVPVIKDFYEPFEKIIEEKDQTLSKHEIINLGDADEMCPECGSKLIYKLGKFGKFLSCSNYPKCEYGRPVDLQEGEESKSYGKCPNCETGEFMLKTGRFGKFLACNNYPECKTTQPYLEKIGMNCPKCENGEIIIKKAKGRIFYGCSNYPECDYSSWKNPKTEETNDEDSGEDLQE